MIKIIIFFLSPFLLFNFVNSAIVECKQTPCSWEDLSNSISNLLRTLVIISFWIAVLMSVIGAFLIMFHGPSPTSYQGGVNLIKVALIGYILILSAGIIFDIILEFFGPKFALAKLSPTTYYQPLRDALMSGLKCGKGATSALDRLFRCIFEVLGLLKNLAVILLAFAIIISAAVLITTPLFGIGNIPKAWKILIWSIIGLVIILTADLIRAQIERLVK